MSDQQDRWSAFFAELKRRRVVRVGLGYAAAAFVVLQAGQLVFDALEVPKAVFRVLVIAALAGFPVAILLGWLFDLTSEGVVLASSRTRGARLVARIRPPVLLGGGCVALLASIGAAIAIGLPKSAAAVVAPGADLIAVLPFSTSGGQDVEVLEEGMVDLLSRNLSEVGSLRTVDPRLVLSRWEERSKKGDLSLEDALALARETYAGSVLTGSVVQAGPSVRISADLFAIDGRRLAAVQVDGAARDLLALVDTVTLRLLREVWRSRQPIPRLDVGAITSSDLGAIRAYLDGERLSRASSWAPAVEALRRAVAADSLFALAHYRLAVAAAWAGEPEAGRRHAAIALRLVDRLPQREATLVRAEALRSAGEVEAAIDTLSAQVERSTDDAEAWFLLADAGYHLRDERAGPGDHPPEQVLSLFDRVLELDATHVPALLHPLEVAYRAADTALVRRYVDLLAAIPTVDTGAVRVYRHGLDALRRPGDGRVAARALAAAYAPGRGTGGLTGQASQAVLLPLLRQAAVLPAEERRAFAASLPAEIRERGSTRPADLPLGQLAISGGRLGEGRRMLEAVLARSPSDRATVRRMLLTPVLAGTADTTFLAASGDLAPTPAERAVAAAVGAIDRDDAAGLRRAAARLRALPAGEHPDPRHLAAVADAFARLLAGDAQAGLNAVEDALEEGGFAPSGAMEAFWFRFFDRLAAHPATRSRARRILERPWPGDPAYEVLRLDALARVLEAEGDAPAARAAYARFADATSGADAGAPLRARADAARAALARLPK